MNNHEMWVEYGYIVKDNGVYLSIVETGSGWTNTKRRAKIFEDPHEASNAAELLDASPSREILRVQVDRIMRML